MQVKNSKVNIWGIHISMYPVMKIVEEEFAKLGHESMVTSGMDGIHSAGSLHYFGRALDYRIKMITDMEVRKKLASTIQERLGYENYFVLLHTTHIHIQYNGDKPVV